MAARKTHSRHTLEIDGRAVPLVVRRHPQARRLILRIADDGQGAVVTIPKWAAFAEGVDMAARKTAWIKRQLAKQPETVAFVDGAHVPLLGETQVIRHCPDGRGIRKADGEIIVAGREEHLSRRLRDWLKAQARMEISARAHEKACRIDKRIGRITVRDTKSRWGSCTAGGNLNFSWRLVLAPEFVLDYVVAHEVAHLHHRDHSAAFWTLAASLTERLDQARDWLHAYGRDLHKYG